MIILTGGALGRVGNDRVTYVVAHGGGRVRNASLNTVLNCGGRLFGRVRALGVRFRWVSLALARNRSSRCAERRRVAASAICWLVRRCAHAQIVARRVVVHDFRHHRRDGRLSGQQVLSVHQTPTGAFQR